MNDTDITMLINTFLKDKNVTDEDPSQDIPEKKKTLSEEHLRKMKEGRERKALEVKKAKEEATVIAVAKQNADEKATLAKLLKKHMSLAGNSEKPVKAEKVTPVKAEKVKAEKPVKAEKVKAEKVKAEKVKAEKVKAEVLEPVKAEVLEPVKAEVLEPVKAEVLEPVKAEKAEKVVPKDTIVSSLPDSDPIHIRRKNIPKHIKTLVWNKYIGRDIAETKCLSCREEVIHIRKFDCGHVLAEAKGGDMTITNLRPICSSCNNAMATNSMNEFTSEFFGWTV